MIQMAGEPSEYHNRLRTDVVSGQGHSGEGNMENNRDGAGLTSDDLSFTNLLMQPW